MKKKHDTVEPLAPLPAIPFPWQSSQWKKSVDAFAGGRMPHAQIFCGNQGLGKREFAMALSLHLFCSSLANGQACGECRNCRLIRTEVHPDFMRIKPEKPTSAIKIDDIRAINEFVNRTSESGVAKVVLIEDADRMNRNAANALLKNLEEPPAGTHFFLVSSREMRLPITIRSRCQLVRFTVPNGATGLQWLQNQNNGGGDCELPMLLAGGAPLEASRLMSDASQSEYAQLFSSLSALCTNTSNPVAEAKALMDTDLSRLLGWMSSWVSSLIRVKSLSDGVLVSTGIERLDQHSANLRIDSLLSFNAAVQVAYKDSLAVSNINRQLILEGLLMSWTRLINQK